jgi:hypothetical protein
MRFTRPLTCFGKGSGVDQADAVMERRLQINGVLPPTHRI